MQQWKTKTLQLLQSWKCSNIFSLRLHYISNLKDKEMMPLHKPTQPIYPPATGVNLWENDFHQSLTHQNSQLTHLQWYPCWPATWCQWGRHWRWHSDQSWAWRAWLWFLKKKIHRSSGIHHTFQLHTSHCWNTIAKMKHKEREEEGSTEGTEMLKTFRKWKEIMSWYNNRNTQIMVRVKS